MPLKNSHDQMESLWAKIRDKTKKEYLAARVYCKPPDQEELVNKIFFASTTRVIMLEGFHPYVESQPFRYLLEKQHNKLQGI